MDLIKEKDKALKVKKFLSFVLQHKPFFYKVRVDDKGLADIHYLTVCIKKKLSIDVTKEDLINIVKHFSGNIFKLNETEDRMGAKAGHTFVYDSHIPDGFESVADIPNILYCSINKEDFYAAMKSDSIPLSNNKIFLLKTRPAPEVGKLCLEVSTQKAVKKSEFYYNNDKYFTKMLAKESVTLHV